MSQIQNFTLSEAGYVLGRTPAMLNKAVDTGVIHARQKKVGNMVQRLLGPAELRFLRLADELDKDLTPAGRRRLYGALRKLPDNAHKLQLGRLELDLAQIDTDLKDRMAKLEAVRGRIESTGARGEAVVRGTAISAHLIAALARDEGIDVVLADFPSMTRDQAEAAVEYAKAYPKRGRPYPTKSLKSTLADLADAGAFDDDGDPGEVAPRTIP
ncbi:MULTISPECIES: DUF433 domain-containing protein [Agrobacterium tumefaciens complex]|uniref:DUF433 domain-containing protein n=1 Tax=Agrobacterium tumefaciens complex TaxID=1183400 RepID=UPI001F452305|nr:MULTISPECIES: DUF433 domain-containing protein [Agrobacterium tumefaciens complex]